MEVLRENVGGGHGLLWKGKLGCCVFLLKWGIYSGLMVLFCEGERGNCWVGWERNKNIFIYFMRKKYYLN